MIFAHLFIIPNESIRCKESLNLCLCILNPFDFNIPINIICPAKGWWYLSSFIKSSNSLSVISVYPTKSSGMLHSFLLLSIVLVETPNNEAILVQSKPCSRKSLMAEGLIQIFGLPPVRWYCTNVLVIALFLLLESSIFFFKVACKLYNWSIRLWIKSAL